MVAFNFSAEFADAVAEDRKRQTIRLKMRAKPGDRLQLYTGQRTTACRKLVKPDPICTAVLPCTLYPTRAYLDGCILSLEERESFAREDGFPDYNSMIDWFRRKYGPNAIVGFVHKWKPAP